jgi:hypothetical protein
METIKFRGKRVDNSDWVYGVPYFLNIIEDEPEDCVNKACIIAGVDWDGLCGFMSPENKAFIEVITETVGQYTGLKDKNAKEIYSGDLIKSNDLIGHVKYHGCAFMIEWHDDVYADLLGWEDFKHGKLSGGSEYQIIANIHENK